MRTTTVVNGAPVEFDEISADDAQALQGAGAVIVDVRNPDERAQKHVAGSIHIPLPELAGRLDEVPEGRVLLVCARGARSAAAAQLIERATGRNDVSSIAGGTDAWAAEGRPLG
jgi:rhodanese-related sulfurtransferase